MTEEKRISKNVINFVNRLHEEKEDAFTKALRIQDRIDQMFKDKELSAEEQEEDNRRRAQKRKEFIAKAEAERAAKRAEEEKAAEEARKAREEEKARLAAAHAQEVDSFNKAAKAGGSVDQEVLRNIMKTALNKAVSEYQSWSSWAYDDGDSGAAYVTEISHGARNVAEYVKGCKFTVYADNEELGTYDPTKPESELTLLLENAIGKSGAHVITFNFEKVA